MRSEDAVWSERVVRQPAVLVAVCFAVGIALDALVLSLDWKSWALGAGLGAGLTLWGRGRWETRFLVGCTCGCWVCLGGLRHHEFWSLRSADDVAQFATERSQLIRLRGQVAEPAWVKPPSDKPFQSAIPEFHTTSFTLECESVQDGERSIPVRGRAQIRVSGHLLNLQVGDEVEVLGWFSRPLPPGNPGDFNYADFLKRSRIGGVVRVQEPEAVRRFPRSDHWHAGRSIAQLRTRAERLFQSQLSERNGPVAAALLLGSRTALPEELLDDFAKSGMMHVLALSGVNVGILAGLILLVCRLLHVSPRLSWLLTMSAVLGLVVISGGRPPIVRAAVFLGLTALGRLANRQANSPNVLALAALFVLGWNPSNLFDVGTQLSFLAVIAILITVRWDVPASDPNWLAPDESQATSWFHQLARVSFHFFKQVWGTMLGIWLLTAPLVAAQFHLISPIGLLLNVVLMPVVTVVLWLGYLMLFFGGLLPPLAGLFAWGLDAGLSLLLGLVAWGAEVRLGHWYVAGPPTWWLIGYYAMLTGLLWWWRAMARPRFVGASCLLSWLAVGLAIALMPRPSPGLRCTFLAVGHGSAILVECPNGKTLLFDAGALDDGDRAFRVIRSALWERGIPSLNGLIISHADLDHVNAVPALIDEVPIRGTFVAKSFLQSPQSIVPFVVRAFKEKQVPLSLIGEDDKLRVDPEVSVEVLHPDPRETYQSPNAGSLVLRLTYAGRTMLLTGDVEREGLAELLSQHAGQVDVLQAPHHGSRTPNTPELAAWADATVVVSSGGYVAGRLEELRAVYGSSTRVFSTADEGAVVVEISPQGHVSVSLVRD